MSISINESQCIGGCRFCFRRFEYRCGVLHGTGRQAYGFKSDPGIRQNSPNAKLTDNRGKDKNGNSSFPSGSTRCGSSSYHYLPAKKSDTNWDNDYYWCFQCCGKCGTGLSVSCSCNYCNKDEAEELF